MREKDFRGFRFGRIHTSDLHLEVISSSDRYEPRLLPDPVDTTSEIPGSDGEYYFGQIYKNREINCEVAFDDVSEEIYRKIRQLFATDKLQDLVFDEEPYKTWKAKLKSRPDFKSLCFTDRETGQRVYKGSGKLSFICYFPYAFGFNKYIVRAADFYMLNPPERIICDISNNDDDIFFNTIDIKEPERWLSRDIKYHYNFEPNDTVLVDGERVDRDQAHQNKTDAESKKTRNWRPNGDKPWKGGFPTIEQVQGGELYFDNGSILDVRGYWDNVPEWEGTAKLLTTPTLDYEQELMYMPQYSKTNFINMEIGYQNYSPMIGSRVLVYNPGDVPIDWEIKINENKRGFWSSRNGNTFRISRYNVERLTIQEAVDWCGLKTYCKYDDKPYKYGNRYFVRRNFDINGILEKSTEITKLFSTTQNKGEKIANAEMIDAKHFPADKNWKKDGDTSSTNSNYDYEDWNTTEEEFYQHRHEKKNAEQWRTPLSCAFNLHLDKMKQYLEPDGSIYTEYLNAAHPHHCYYAEPIPREQLGHYIRLFYWQTLFWRGDEKRPQDPLTKLFKVQDGWIKGLLDKLIIQKSNTYYITDVDHPFADFLRQFYIINADGKLTAKDSKSSASNYYKDLDYEEGLGMAERYEELYEDCITDEERFELYWKTLHDLIDKFEPIMPNGESTDSLFYDYINNPVEYVPADGRDLDYDQVLFNGYKYPSWITPDYLEVDADLLSGVSLAKQYLAAIGQDETTRFEKQNLIYNPDLLDDSKYKSLKLKLNKYFNKGDNLATILEDSFYVNSEERMLYSTENPYGIEFAYKPTKNVMNEAVVKGRWFKLPPGWSVLCIEPVVDENAYGGKRWLDSRPFDWGYGGDSFGHKREVQQLFDFVYEEAQQEFIKTQYNLNEIRQMIPKENLSPDMILMQESSTSSSGGPQSGAEEKKPDLDHYLRFKVWYADKYTDDTTPNHYFTKQYYKHKQQNAEYTFLKIINEIWQILSPYYSWTAEKGAFFDCNHNDYSIQQYDINNKPLHTINGDINDWWWYACNYLWANFPPVYWGAADTLNSLKIEYTPLFY